MVQSYKGIQFLVIPLPLLILMDQMQTILIIQTLRKHSVLQIIHKS